MRRAPSSCNSAQRPPVRPRHGMAAIRASNSKFPHSIPAIAHEPTGLPGSGLGQQIMYVPRMQDGKDRAEDETKMDKSALHDVRPRMQEHHCPPLVCPPNLPALRRRQKQRKDGGCALALRVRFI